MPTRMNQYYNDPAIGAAFSNLASIFEPPAPQDLLAYAQAAKVRKENEGLEALYGMAGDPNADTAAFDRWGAVTGAWNPTSGFGARDMGHAATLRGQDIGAATQRYGIDTGAATARRGQDISANTAITTNRLNNQTQAIGDLFQPLNQGQVRPAVPDEFLGVLDLPGAEAAQGLPKPLSETEVEGQLLLDAITGGYYTAEDEALARRSAVPVEQIVDEGGDPMLVNRADAVGQQPYINPGSQPSKTFKTWRSSDGAQSGVAVLDPSTGTGVDLSSRQPLPPGAILGDVVDTAEGMTTGSNTAVQQRGMAITSGLETLSRLENLVRTSPSSQGAAGYIRGTAQDVIQTGGELGQLFGGTIEEVVAAAQADPALAAVLPEMYDPNIPAIEMLTNVLAWQYAKSFAGDRVSNEQLRIAKQAIGGSGLFANQAQSLARLGELRTMFLTEGQRLNPLLPPQLQAGLAPHLGAPGAAPAAAAAPTGSAPTAPAVGTIDGGYEFLGGDPALSQNWRKVQ